MEKLVACSRSLLGVTVFPVATKLSVPITAASAEPALGIPASAAPIT